jgi:voltage-gated potassium channel
MTREPSPLRNLYLSIACLTAVIVTGTLGYMFIEGWTFTEAVYMTIITVGSVGFREVRSLDPVGEWFTIGLILFGMGTLVYGITNLTAFVVEGDLQKLLRRSRMDKNLDKLKDHFILCGVGRIGKNIAEEILRMGYPLVIIDSDEKNLQEQEAKGFDTFTILGDATEEKTLEKAGLLRAKGFISALPTDSENLFVVVTARQLNPSLRIIARVNEEENSQKMVRAGADKTVCPSHIGGLRMASELLRPAAVDFLDKMIREKEASLRVEEAIVTGSGAVAGKTLAEAQIPKKTGCVVVALRRKDGAFEFNPSADTLLDSGDALIVIGEIPKIALLKKLTGETLS